MKRFLAIGIAALPVCSCTEKAPQGPNIIFILADDLGYGDLGCMGQERFSTPNIDSLASEGILFTRHYAGSSVSAPSRSSLITGLHTGHTPIRGNKELPDEGQYPLPGDTYNIFRLVKTHGYSTGVFGKWGLGGPGTEGAPERQGVDEFYGYNCQRLAHNYYPRHLWHNGEKVVLEGNRGRGEGDYAPALIHRQALDFIRTHKDGPFLMMYTSILPHAELRLPEEEIARYAGKLEPETVYHGTDEGPYYKNGGYGSQEHPHAAFAAMVSVLDRQVGELMKALEETGQADNTIVIFTSDNGPHIEGGADPEYFNSNGGLRGIKRDLYEGGIRVPMIVRWPGHIEPGRVTDHVSAFWDFMPTVADILDMTLPYDTDGISYLPTLLGRGEQPGHEYLYWEFHENGGRQAILKGDWKGIVYDVTGGGNMQLYNLAEDPSEEYDLACSYPAKAEMLREMMNASRTESDLFKFGSVAYNGDK